jgi:hypothetical protein
MPQNLPLPRAASIALATALVLFAPSVSAAPAAQPSAGLTVTAALTGAAEVPPGDEDATGSFTGTFNASHDQLCYELKIAKFNTPTAAHIHQGTVGKNGGPVVMLEPPKTGAAKACVAVAADLALKLLDQPQNYYVNVHNAAYPDGGLRGQLAK